MVRCATAVPAGSGAAGPTDPVDSCGNGSGVVATSACLAAGDRREEGQFGLGRHGRLFVGHHLVDGAAHGPVARQQFAPDSLVVVRDAQAHSDEDRKRREEIEVRNTAASTAYQVERQLRELGDRVPVNEKARAEQLIAEIRELVKNDSSDVARLRQLTSDLQQVGYGLASSGYAQSTAAGAQPGGSTGAQPGGDDDVIDADFKKT